jgi:hypothetical protein
VGTRARGALNDSVHAWSTFNGIFPGRADVVRGKVFACAPSADWIVGASESVVAIVLAACALSEVVETEVAFQAIGGREGRQARSLSDVLCLGAGDGDDDGRGGFPFATFVGGEPAGVL